MDLDMDPSTVLITLREQIEPLGDGDLIGLFYMLDDLYERKLWYQLTEVLSQQFYKNPNSKGIRLKLFENFILKFNEKINQLKLIEFLVLSLDDCTPSDALDHLINLKHKIEVYGKKRSKNNDNIDDNDAFSSDLEIIQSLLFIDIEIAALKLKLGFVDEASATIDACSKKIDQLNWSVDNKINASYYSTTASLMKIKGDYTAFYYNSLLFLACIDNLDDLNNKETIVKEVCISALLGEKIYNFGEIIMHNIFKYLEISWLKNLLLSLNNGDLAEFQKVISNEDDLKQIPEVYENLVFLKQKICIMSLIELIFHKPTQNKVVKFDEILSQVNLLKNYNEVEHLIIKCASLGLIKCLINEVESEVEVSWIQPRIMTIEQIQGMKDKLVIWNEKVSDLNNYMSEAGQELWV
ncbi:hypothetical protein CANARDRAFT_197500 [[Candida] arabinofermentans NRRL YB-2248]|uniref:PCI domain-containing protein n=1 Tax=[Candida] arabinofermentans NRRL YB-2248 TaxID=983967 RepID=A0A1E4T293_9ASCO|nr:hypothetical protein CANARDRAFT_197500 [[Candida] arabinofermentans NRRL YB-2248]